VLESGVHCINDAPATQAESEQAELAQPAASQIAELQAWSVQEPEPQTELLQPKPPIPPAEILQTPPSQESLVQQPDIAKPDIDGMLKLNLFLPKIPPSNIFSLLSC
jgi:hypothetical protein